MAATQLRPGDGRLNAQEKKLQDLNHEVGRTGAVFEAAQRAREAHQRQLNEMVEETLRIIAKTRGHGHQKCQRVRGATKSYAASFEHSMEEIKKTFRHELDDRCELVEKTFVVLENRMAGLEGDLDTQREIRKVLIEEKLGPIRDEERRILAALETERRQRRLEEERRGKILQDEVEAITVLIDKEKFARELQSADFDRLAISEQHKAEKRQYQVEKERQETFKAIKEDIQEETRERIEKERQETFKAIKEDIQEETRERIEKQQGVIESIAAFVKRYRGQVLKEVEVQNMTLKHR